MQEKYRKLKHCWEVKSHYYNSSDIVAGVAKLARAPRSANTKILGSTFRYVTCVTSPIGV